MKIKNKILSLALLALLGSPLAAANSSIDVKVGAASAAGPGRIGFDGNASYNVALNPNFTLGGQFGVHWLSWDEPTGITGNIGNLPTQINKTSNAYNLPLMLNLNFVFPMGGGGDWGGGFRITPFFTLGAGYSMLVYNYSTPGYTDTTTSLIIPAATANLYWFGFTYQIMAGASIPVNPQMNLLAEVGYRGSQPGVGTQSINMSGLVLHIGAQFLLGGSSYSDGF